MTYYATRVCSGYEWDTIVDPRAKGPGDPLCTSSWPEEIPVAVRVPLHGQVHNHAPLYRLAVSNVYRGRSLIGGRSLIADAVHFFTTSRFALLIVHARLLRRGFDPAGVEAAMSLCDGPHLAANALIACVGTGFLARVRRALEDPQQGLYETVLRDP